MKAKTEDKFAAWIRTFGVMELAMKFGCHQATVEAWVARRTLPTVINMKELVNVTSGGKLTYVDIIEPFFEVNPHLLTR